MHSGLFPSLRNPDAHAVGLGLPVEDRDRSAHTVKSRSQSHAVLVHDEMHPSQALSVAAFGRFLRGQRSRTNKDLTVRRFGVSFSRALFRVTEAGANPARSRHCDRPSAESQTRS
jgi:hypothetical protein